MIIVVCFCITLCRLLVLFTPEKKLGQEKRNKLLKVDDMVKRFLLGLCNDGNRDETLCSVITECKISNVLTTSPYNPTTNAIKCCIVTFCNNQHYAEILFCKTLRENNEGNVSMNCFTEESRIEDNNNEAICQKISFLQEFRNSSKQVDETTKANCIKQLCRSDIADDYICIYTTGISTIISF